MAVEFLSEPWLDELARLGGELAVVEGASMVLQHEIAGAPAGKVRFFIEWVDGQVRAASLGKHGEPDIVIQAKAVEALRILTGDLSPDVAYMQGRLKVDGDYRRLLVDLRGWRESADYRGLWSAMAAHTA